MPDDFTRQWRASGSERVNDWSVCLWLHGVPYTVGTYRMNQSLRGAYSKGWLYKQCAKPWSFWQVEQKNYFQAWCQAHTGFKQPYCDDVTYSMLTIFVNQNYQSDLNPCKWNKLTAHNFSSRCNFVSMRTQCWNTNQNIKSWCTADMNNTRPNISGEGQSLTKGKLFIFQHLYGWLLLAQINLCRTYSTLLCRKLPENLLCVTIYLTFHNLL